MFQTVRVGSQNALNCNAMEVESRWEEDEVLPEDQSFVDQIKEGKQC